MEKYEMVRDIGSGNFGVAMLMRNKETKELVAVKHIERGLKIDENVAREIINHYSLRHPNIIRFKEVVLTPTHLGIVMEYAGGGELFNRICDAGRFSEDEARYFFQQLISGVSYCHHMMADVWSCGVTLYVMLVGAYPFEDPEDPKNFRKTIQRIMSVQYVIPDYVYVTQNCRQLLARIFVASPSRRITMNEIKKHPWFLKNLPKELAETAQVAYFKTHNGAPTFSLQAVEDIMKIVREARTRGPYSKSMSGYGWPAATDKDDDEDEEEIDEEELEEDDDEEDEYYCEESVREAASSKEASAGSSRRKETPASAADRVNSEEFLEFTFDLI